MKTKLPLLRLSLSLLLATFAGELVAHPPLQPGVTITEVFKRADPQDKDHDIIVLRIELEPGVSAAPHVHPGMVTGYVISGTLEFQVAGESALTLHAGETFFEPPGSKHILARNPSKTEKTVLV